MFPWRTPSFLGNEMGTILRQTFSPSEIHVGSVFKSDNIILHWTQPQDVCVAPGDRVLFVWFSYPQ
jgi:hypothetical protein